MGLHGFSASRLYILEQRDYHAKNAGAAGLAGIVCVSALYANNLR